MVKVHRTAKPLPHPYVDPFINGLVYKLQLICVEIFCFLLLDE